MNRSGDGVEDDDGEKPDWQYFESLLFLKDQYVPRNFTGNFEVSSSEALEETEDAEEESAAWTKLEATSNHSLLHQRLLHQLHNIELKSLLYLKKQKRKKKLKQPMLLGRRQNKKKLHT